jgi:phosphoserine phosphatase RsbU/P
MSAPRRFFDNYTRDLTSADFHRLFTRDAPEAYRFFARGLDFDKLADEPWYRRWPVQARLFFTAFTMKLSPARRVLYAIALLGAFIGMLSLFRGFAPVKVLIFPFSVYLPLPHWVDGTIWLFAGFVLANLLILMEVADRLSLKSDLEVARDIQLAMLPSGIHTAGDTTICGVTRPANTVGGDFYDILPRPDGRLVIALGDVAGKGSPAALLMALLLAMMRTLVDEGLETSRLVARLNVQISRHSPGSRFITLFYGLYNPSDGTLYYVNAGHLPPLLKHRDGRLERIGPEHGGLALGMFEQATYETRQLTIEPGDLFLLFSDGLTEAEDRNGQPFEERGIEAVIAQRQDADPQALGRALLAAVEAHAGDMRLADDLTALILKRT